MIGGLRVGVKNPGAFSAEGTFWAGSAGRRAFPGPLSSW